MLLLTILILTIAVTLIITNFINAYSPAKPTQDELTTTLVAQMTGLDIDKLLHHNDSVLITVTINNGDDSPQVYQNKYIADDWFGDIQLIDNLK